MFYVYRVDRLNGIPTYVGKGKGQRFIKSRTKSHNKHLRSIIAKSGGVLPVRIIRSGLTEAAAFALEIELIANIGREDLGSGPLVNNTDGGEGVSGRVGWTHSEDTRIKIRAIRTGKRWTQEAKRRASEAKRGKPNLKLRGRAKSVDQIQRHAATLRGRKWWRTLDGVKYQAHQPRSIHDLSGMGTNNTEGILWWSTPKGIEYKATMPRSVGDRRGRVSMIANKRGNNTKGNLWWNTVDGTEYMAAMPRNVEDKRGRVTMANNQGGVKRRRL